MSNDKFTLENDQKREYTIDKNGVQTIVSVLQHRNNEVYIHYASSDSRLDEWRLESDLKEVMNGAVSPPPVAGRKRQRESSNDPSPSNAIIVDERPLRSNANGAEKPQIAEESQESQNSTKCAVKRNFDKVNFGHWQIKTWYYSPYPLWETEPEDHLSIQSSSNKASPAPGSKNIVNIRSLTRASDLFIGNVGQDDVSTENTVLWVCDRCFKYMRDGMSFELHSKICHIKSPPGKKIYQRGAHIIWEVDGAKEKLYCQNLSLFGKLFIDVKTLFFDCDNFLFYILTDADSQRDHVLGFFSKEKISYDNYNLACIVILPPYQRKGYGMLLIEFSYELSRRTGHLGTPERPLSDLGLRSYLTYWVATIVRFLRRVLTVFPSEVPQLSNSRLENEVLRLFSPESEDSTSKSKRKRSHAKDNGTGLSMYAQEDEVMSSANDAFIKTMRFTRTTNNPDGSATTHVFVKCTLEDIAHATSLRVEDVAFALNESGLLTRTRQLIAEGKTEELIVISREMVEAVAKDRSVKRMCMDVKHVLC